MKGQKNFRCLHCERSAAYMVSEHWCCGQCSNRFHLEWNPATQEATERGNTIKIRISI